MRIFLISFFILLCGSPGAFATDWYVDGANGKQNNPGTQAAPFLTSWQADAVVKPGDTIHFLPTVTYGPIAIFSSGTAAAPITLTGAGVAPNLTTVSGQGSNFGIQVNEGASFIVVENFNVSAAGPWNGVYIGNNSHNVTIANNVIHDSGHCGINSTHADYLTITGNLVYNNATYTADGIFCSGISTYENNNSDSNTGIKNIIADNIVYNNINTPTCNNSVCYGSGYDSDGNGIILDDSRHTQSDNVVYNGKTLVENNIVFNNGGRGIYAYYSDHAIFVNNTVYYNNQDAYESAWEPGEIMVEGGGGDIQIYNNIAYSAGLSTPLTGNQTVLAIEDANDGVGSVTADYNLLYNAQGNAGYMYYAGTLGQHTDSNSVTFGTNNLFADPQFKAPSTNASTANFTLQNTSPGRGTADAAMAPATDINGNARPSANDDMGAYQQATVPVCGTSNNTVVSSVPTANLCAVGTASAVAGSGPWSWTCASAGTTASCQALMPTLTISITASGDDYQGDPIMALYVNGILQGQSTVTAVHSQNQWQTFVYTMLAPASLQSIGIMYTNDVYGGPGADRNLYVQSVTVNGTNLTPQQGTYTHWGTSQAGQVDLFTTGTLLFSNTPLAGMCGAANGMTLAGAPANGLCNVGAASSVSGSGPWGWTCAGLNGGATVSCAAATSTQSQPAPVNGACGASNGSTVSSAPSSSLCNSGSASSVSGSGPWAWSCAGSNGGSTASCVANLALAPVNGSCGSSNGATFSTTPSSGLCGSGSPSSISGNGPWSWNCIGSNGGSNSSCSANLTPPSVNGSCGSSNGATLTSAPTTGLCNSGSASSVSGSGPWAWSCAGSNGGSTASCAANIQPSAPPPSNGVCGAANGNITKSIPASGLCNSGGASSVSLVSNNWIWTCSGSNGGATASCAAPK